MRLGILSDSHDHLKNLQEALELLRGRGAEFLLHAGDIVSPFAAKVLVRCGLPVLAVFGNNDGERKGLAKLLDIAPGPRRLELGGRCIILAHDPADVSEELASGADAVVVGHTHEALVEPGNPLRLNPGETGGWLFGRATCALLDLERLEAEICTLGGP